MVLPNLVVIGAAKCGTTSLHEYLDVHPEVSMSREKELNFFVEGKNWERGLDWYESRFSRSATIRGESSPTYSAYPFHAGVPERISRVLPGVKILYLVRDPIDRIVSHYQHRSVRYPEMGSLEDALQDSELRAWFVGISRYALQLERYLDHVPREHVRVVDSDELHSRRDETLAQIFSFLGVDSGFRSEVFDRVHNRAIGRERRTATGRVAVNLLNRALGPQRTSTLARQTPAALKSRFRYSVERPTLSQPLRERLATELRDDVDRLRKHTGLAFAGWSL